MSKKYKPNSISEFTGNIFVDSGQLTLLTLLNTNSFHSISTEELKSLKESDEIFGIKWISENIISFKSFTMIFGTNHMRMQYVYRPNNETIFKAFLNSLVDGIVDQLNEKNNMDLVCDICGLKHNYNYNSEFDKILEENYEKYDPKKESYNFVCRELFPLSGSMGSEAQNYSNMSITQNFCPRCLLMIHYLPFSSEVIEGKLALFQLSNIEIWQRFIKKNCNENKKIINNTPKGKKFRNLGKKLKNKNFRIFEHFLDYFEEKLPTSPSREDFLNNTPQKSLSALLWKFSNSGQGPYLEYEEIPNMTIAFLYLCYCFDLSDSIKKILQKELRKIKFPPKQFYNSIKTGNLYEFEQLIDKKFHPDINLQFLYYYYILGYKGPEIEILIRIALNLIESYPSEELVEIMKRMANITIFKSIRDLLKENKIRIQDYLNIFGLIPYSQNWKKGYNIIKQLCKTGISLEEFNSFKKNIELILEKDNLNHFNSHNKVEFDEQTRILISNFIKIYNYFKSKFSFEEIGSKIAFDKMKRAPLAWFVNIYCKVILKNPESKKLTYSNLQFLLTKNKSWTNLRRALQLLFIIFPTNKDLFIIYEDYEYSIPKLIEKKYVNPKLKQQIENYLFFRIKIQRNGVNYIKRAFILPLLRGVIRTNTLRLFFDDHSEDIGFSNSDWKDLLINPKSGKEDKSYFLNFIKIHSCSYISNKTWKLEENNDENIPEEEKRFLKEFNEISLNPSNHQNLEKKNFD